MQQRIKYILTFSKKGMMRFISHLDLIALFDRALRRSKFPLYYTEGFNPKIKMSFAQAYSLGKEIESDIFSILLLEDIRIECIKETLNAFLPAGIRILNVEKS